MGHSQAVVHSARDSLLELARPRLTDDDVEQLARQNAALRIQRAWRAKRRASYLGADFLWSDLITRARFQVDRNAAEQGKNTARERWRRAIFLALRLQDGNQMLADVGVADNGAAKKFLETQHWLELIDGKHRYGANLKYYHRRWQTDTTTDNFFRWLDYGTGKDLSLKECPREQLEKERISYLSPSQRLNYLVQIDNDGKLRWAKSGQVVDTTVGRWKDAGRGQGIVPFDRPSHEILQHRTSFEVTAKTRSPSREVQQNAQMHYYLGPRPTGNRIKTWLWRNATPRGLLERLLRNTLQKNTWIYVSDKHFNIFIGIKTAGTFQHSSFLGGGLVTSAGLISVKDGVIHKLSPLSGHYRTSIQHFRRFLTVLEEKGIDMHKVQISKAEAALWGLERINKFKKKQARMVDKGKDKVAGAVRRARSVAGRSERSTSIDRSESKRHANKSNGDAVARSHIDSHPPMGGSNEPSTPQTDFPTNDTIGI